MYIEGNRNWRKHSRCLSLREEIKYAVIVKNKIFIFFNEYFLLYFYNVHEFLSI